MEPVLYLVRHGKTSANSKNLFRGDSDVPLTAAGRKDADEASEYLKDISPDFIVCSDRIRAVETADILSNTFGHTPIKSSKLRAWDVGDFTGKPRDEANLAELQKYIDDPRLDVPGGESLDEFRSRVLPVIKECFDQVAGHAVGFIVCHSSVIRAVSEALYEDNKTLYVDPGGIVVIGFEDDQPTAKRIFKSSRPDANSNSIS